jgi:hypothetical protein
VEGIPGSGREVLALLVVKRRVVSKEEGIPAVGVGRAAEEGHRPPAARERRGPGIEPARDPGWRLRVRSGRGRLHDHQGANDLGAPRGGDEGDDAAHRLADQEERLSGRHLPRDPGDVVGVGGQRCIPWAPLAAAVTAQVECQGPQLAWQELRHPRPLAPVAGETVDEEHGRPSPPKSMTRSRAPSRPRTTGVLVPRASDIAS